MATKKQSLTVPAKQDAGHECHCGCSPCDGSCCGLDCIVKPRFFCGQLLTDADLSDLLKWARDRFGLTRYRHGWGVVCGLDVRCDPEVPTGVIIGPGYAVDCCGDDIVICEDASLDLKDKCREDEDPCADLRRVYQQSGSIAVGLQGYGGLNLALGKNEILEEAKSRLRVVDIYVRYDEKHFNPSTAMGRGSCKQVTECEYSRTRESYKLTSELGVVGSDPMLIRAMEWHEGYEKCLDVLTKFRAKFGNNFPGTDVRRWLLQWIDNNPQHHLCSLRDFICQHEVAFFTVERNLVKILFEMVQSCRNAYLNCACFGCDEDSRVPLARVWLMGEDRATSGQCRVLAIDAYPPYRRPIQSECWLAPLGSVNVGRFIWHRWDEVCREVGDLGLRVKPKPFNPVTLRDLSDNLKCDLFMKCGQARVALVYDSGLLGERVVGFCEPDGGPPKPHGFGLTVLKSVSPTTAHPAEGLSYSFSVTNTGDRALDIRLSDNKLNYTFSDPNPLQPAETRKYNTRGSAPTAPGEFVNEVTVEGSVNGAVMVTEKAQTKLIVTVEERPCPSIGVSAPNEVAEGTQVNFTLVITGPQNFVMKYNWSVSAGTIVAGQGTPQITVDTTGLGGQTIDAKIEITGLDPQCENTASGRTTVLTGIRVDPRKFDEFGNIEFQDEKARLDNFSIVLQNAPAASGHILAYAPDDPEATARFERAKDYLINTRGIDASRIGGKFAKSPHPVTTELWLVPPGATAPPLSTGGRIRNDNLEVIDMIGRATADKLNAAGIRNTEDLASTSVERLQEIFPRHKKDMLAKWIEDAKNQP